jgi:hypothetical protein
MNRPDIDLVFGRGRLRMATGHHVEVFREASLPGQRRRYSKRFLAIGGADFRHWTEREGNVLARLVGLGVAPVPCIEPFDRGAEGRLEQVRTYDAGVTVEHWATRLPVQRDGTPLRHVFEDCAHWWALARHCLMALEALHYAQVVHLDLKPDNLCIPFDPAEFDPAVPGATLALRFEELALIDFAFALVPGESPGHPLPLAQQPDYDYQSPRLLSALEAGRQGDLVPTLQLDWRCDFYSLAAMLRRYLPGPETPTEFAWAPWHEERAGILVRRLLEAHDSDETAQRPHRNLIAFTNQALADAEVRASLARGWALAEQDAMPAPGVATPPTRVDVPALAEPEPSIGGIDEIDWAALAADLGDKQAPVRRTSRATGWITAAAVCASMVAAVWWALQPPPASEHRADAAVMTRADTVRVPPPLPVPSSSPAPATAPAVEPPPVAVTQAAPQPVEPEASAVQPISQPEPPAAPPVAVAPVRQAVQPPRVASARPPATAPARVQASTRSRRTTASTPAPAAAAAAAQADRPWVDQTERERALEWLTKRGPAGAPVGLASAAAPSSVNHDERERALDWLTKRGPAPRPGMSYPPGTETAPASVPRP